MSQSSSNHITRIEFERAMKEMRAEIRRIDHHVIRARQEYEAQNRRLDRIVYTLIQLRDDMQLFNNLKTWTTGVMAALGTAIGYTLISLLQHGYHP